MSAEKITSQPTDREIQEIASGNIIPLDWQHLKETSEKTGISPGELSRLVNYLILIPTETEESNNNFNTEQQSQTTVHQPVPGETSEEDDRKAAAASGNKKVGTGTQSGSITQASGSPLFSRRIILGGIAFAGVGLTSAITGIPFGGSDRDDTSQTAGNGSAASTSTPSVSPTRSVVPATPTTNSSLLAPSLQRPASPIPDATKSSAAGTPNSENRAVASTATRPATVTATVTPDFTVVRTAESEQVINKILKDNGISSLTTLGKIAFKALQNKGDERSVSGTYRSMRFEGFPENEDFGTGVLVNNPNLDFVSTKKVMDGNSNFAKVISGDEYDRSVKTTAEKKPTSKKSLEELHRDLISLPNGAHLVIAEPDGTKCQHRFFFGYSDPKAYGSGKYVAGNETGQFDLMRIITENRQFAVYALKAETSK